MTGEDIKRIEERVTKIVEKLLKNTDMVLVDVSFKGIGGRRKLEVAIDKEGGVTLSECEKISNELSLALDAEEIISGPYILEVGSPGLDRILKSERELNWAVGKKVLIYTTNDQFTGILTGLDNSFVYLEKGMKIPRNEITKIKLNEV